MDDLADLDAETREILIAARNAPPPFATEEDVDNPIRVSQQELAAALKSYKTAQSKMRAARREMEKLKPLIRDAAFEYWLRRYVERAERRGEWTQATPLYENYIKHAAECGGNGGETAILKSEVASDTRFGILLREAGFESDRRSNGNYYPLRLKQGA